jgi:hypothetical protein
MRSRDTESPTPGEMLAEVIDLAGGLGILILPLFPLALPALILLIPLALLALPLAILAAPVALIVFLRRQAQRHKSARSRTPTAPTPNTTSELRIRPTTPTAAGTSISGSSTR